MALTIAVLAVALSGGSRSNVSLALGSTTCDVARASGTAAIGCAILKSTSPYTSGGLGGSRMGANVQALAAIEDCIRRGDTRSAQCRTGLTQESSLVLAPAAPGNLHIVQ